MDPEHAIAACGLGFLLTGGVLMLYAVRRGGELCRRLAERLPAEYAEWGSPRPGYFNSLRRSAYNRFLMQRHFLKLPDPQLAAEFSDLRSFEVKFVAFLLGGFGVLGLAFLWLRLWQG